MDNMTPNTEMEHAKQEAPAVEGNPVGPRMEKLAAAGKLTSKNSDNKPVGVIGAGSFGAAIANILAKNSALILYARNPLVTTIISEKGKLHGQEMSENISPTNDLKYVAENCDVIFPIVPSDNFPALIDELSPFLKPYHILIHGTKGLIVSKEGWQQDEEMKIGKNDVYTMSRLISERSLAVRIGCLAGPNLAGEITNQLPAGTVIASRFDEVIHAGKAAIESD